MEIGSTYFDECCQAIEDKEEGMIDYDKFGKIVFGPNCTYSDDYLQRTHAMLKQIMPHIKDDLEDSLGEEYLEKLRLAEQKAYKKKKAVADQVRILNQTLTKESRAEGILEGFKDALDEMPPMRFKFKSYDTNSVILKDGGALLSDIHLGLGIDSQFNYYSIDVAIERMNEWKNKVIHRCVEQNVTKLSICMLGDLISGIIQLGPRIRQEADACKQIMIVTKAIAESILEIQQYIPEIVVYSVYGNHGRVHANKNESIDPENFEQFIPWGLRHIFAKDENCTIKVIDSGDADFILADIAGRKVFLTHGNRDKVNNVVENAVRILGVKPDEVYMGHIHHPVTIDNCGTDIVCNGAMCGSDDYAISIRQNTPPSQILRVYDGDTVIQYKLMLGEDDD